MNDVELKQELTRLLLEKEQRAQYNQLDSYFPNDGPYSREHYLKHMSFLAAGAKYSERAFIAGNRIGKSVCAAYEVTCHLLGWYPDWWEGRRFEHPISAWAAGITNESTKTVIQEILFGPIGQLGTGLIPKDKIIMTSNRPGVPNAIGYAQIKHSSGGRSEIELKSYVQGWETFQGAQKQVIWLDEEPAERRIYTECLTRTAGGRNKADGIILCTFTPQYGLSDIVLSFVPDGQFPPNGVPPTAPQKFVVKAGWEDVPHLSAEWKQKTLASYAPWEVGARTKGEPSLGAGAVYPIPETEIVVDPFEIPSYWPKAYGLDVGWNRTAAIWAALCPDDNRIYLYSEHYVGAEKPPVHASAIKARGEWVFGAIDPRSDSRSQADGNSLLQLYIDEGLHLVPADNSVESGIYKVWDGLASGQVKVFKTCSNWLAEYRIYRRDENGKVVKKNDHLMDATRYLFSTGLELMDVPPDYDDDLNEEWDKWDTGSSMTGY